MGAFVVKIWTVPLYVNVARAGVVPIVGRKTARSSAMPTGIACRTAQAIVVLVGTDGQEGTVNGKSVRLPRMVSSAEEMALAV